MQAKQGPQDEGPDPEATLAPVSVLNSTVSLIFAYACTWKASYTFSPIRPFASSASSALAVPGFLRLRRVRRVFALSAAVMVRRVRFVFAFSCRCMRRFSLSIRWSCQRRLRLLGLLFAGGGVSSSPLESPSLELLLPPDLVSSPAMSKHSSDHTRLLAPYLRNRRSSPGLPLKALSE
jgi:hypothetical protein